MEESKLSLQVLREAIPEHCFQPSLKKSLLYLARDFLYAGSLVYLATYLSSSSFDIFTICGWTLYSILQGFVGTGLWILAHECGHGAFSDYGCVNDTVGWVVHSLLLVPYFSWKYTHARHHRFTSHMTKDTAFVPPTKAEVQASKDTALGLWRQATEDMPLAILFTFLAHQLLGWPAYLLSYVSAGEENGTFEMFKSHFDPWSGIFTAKQQPFVALSDLGLAIVCGSLYYLATQLSFLHVVLLYVLPYLWVNHWIVAITYLHHTHPEVPHYGEDEWTFLRGSLSTVDRHFGFIGRHFFHEIIDYHQIHHLFARIPFYYAEEATEAVRPILGPSYHEAKKESFLLTLIRTFKSCKYMVPKIENDKTSRGVFVWEI